MREATYQALLDRLKSLPLTIFLSVLIWMYAEAQVHSVGQDEAIRTAVVAVAVHLDAPPEMLVRYDVEVQPTTVNVTVAGPARLIDDLDQRVQGGSDAGVIASLVLTPADRPSEFRSQRQLLYVPPPGLSIKSMPADVTFRLRERPPPTAPATGK